MRIQTSILNRLKNLDIFDELKYIVWTYKSVLVKMYRSSIFNNLEKTFFLQFLSLFIKKYLHFIAISTQNL